MLEKVPKRPGRTKRTRKKDRVKTPEIRAHMLRIKEKGCACCATLGIYRPGDYHHEYPPGGIRDDRYGFGLCKQHHTDGPLARHGLSRRGFEKQWGINPEELARANWAESVEMRSA